MSRWTVAENKDVGASIVVDNVIAAVIVSDRELARQIVREHNAHEGLVKAMKDVTARLCDWCGECGDIGESSKPCKYISEARAVLAQVEGRE